MFLIQQIKPYAYNVIIITINQLDNWTIFGELIDIKHTL